MGVEKARWILQPMSKVFEAHGEEFFLSLYDTNQLYGGAKPTLKSNWSLGAWLWDREGNKIKKLQLTKKNVNEFRKFKYAKQCSVRIKVYF